MQLILPNRVNISNKNFKTMTDFDVSRSLDLVFLLKDLGISSISIGSASQIVVSSSPNNITGLILALVKSSNTNFKIMLDITVIDRPQNLNRFSLNYNLRNWESGLTLKVRTFTNQFKPQNSISSIVMSSLGAEREAMDMFGLKFSGHRELRRIIGDYSFWGFPLRKDFPMGGYFEYFFSLALNRVSRVRGNFYNFWGLNFQTWKNIINKINCYCQDTCSQLVNSVSLYTNDSLKGLEVEIFNFYGQAVDIITNPALGLVI